MMGWMATLQIRDRCESRDLIVGPPRLELYRRSAYYVKRILDGERPVTDEQCLDPSLGLS